LNVEKIFYRHGLLKKEFYPIAKLNIVFVMPILSKHVEIILYRYMLKVSTNVSSNIFYFFHTFPVCTKLRAKEYAYDEHARFQ
jgi:hypothetical protein